jgi:2-polyprenyl-6-methoxyphenol hydroxylase-like FAD-dependent oxidoreductase
MKSFDAVIVGGGVGGLAMGYKLARDGRKVCVLEMRQGTSRSKRGVTLQPNGLAALAELGLLSDVESLGVPIRHVSFYDLGHHLLAELDWSVLEHPQNYLLTVVPSELEALLRNRLENAGGSIYDSTSFVSFERREGLVAVKAQTGGRQSEYLGKILIGADGENSRVRSSLAILTQIKQYRDHFLLTLLKGRPIQEEGRQYFGRSKMMGVFPAHDSTYIFYYVRSGRFEELRTRGVEAFRQDLLSIEPELGGLIDSVASWDDVLYVKPRRVDVSSWVADRVALIGDALHALNPSIGQGLNMTLVDVVTLAGVLGKCFESGDFSAAAMKPYEDSRRKVIEFMQDQAEMGARLSATESRLVAWYAKRLLKKVNKRKERMQLAIEVASGLRDRISLSEIIRSIL